MLCCELSGLFRRSGSLVRHYIDRPEVPRSILRGLLGMLSGCMIAHAMRY